MCSRAAKSVAPNAALFAGGLRWERMRVQALGDRGPACTRGNSTNAGSATSRIDPSHKTTPRARRDNGGSANFRAAAVNQEDFDGLPSKRDAQFAVAQDARGDEHGLITIRNPGNVG